MMALLSLELYIGLAVIAIFLPVSLGNTNDNSIPKRINVFRKTERSLEIRAEKALNHQGKADTEFEPCHGHIVQFQLVNGNSEPLDSEWEYATSITETTAGRFLLYNLNPGTEYFIRVACSDTNFNQNSPREFSRHIKAATLNNEVKNSVLTQTTSPNQNNQSFENWSVQNDLGQNDPLENVLQSDTVKNYWGVVGNWVNLSCVCSSVCFQQNTSALSPIFEWSHKNQTLDEGYGIHFTNSETESLLQVLLYTEEFFGEYSCIITINQSKTEENLFYVNRGQRAPAIKLSPTWVTMGAAKFQVEIVSPNLAEEDGTYLPVIGYSVQYKHACHIRSDWLDAEADITIDPDGFVITNLIPNEGYYVRAASKNVGSTGPYADYWKIKTSSAVLIRMNISNSGKNKILCHSLIAYLTLIVFDLP